VISLFKRFLFILLSLCCVFSCTVFASDYFTINTGSEFFVYGEDNEKVAKALNISVDEIKDYCGKNVIYLAVNKKNSKQIRLTTGQNAFTYSVVNISNFSNDKISALIPQITEIEDIKGEIVDKNGQKFIKTELRGVDSGGDYILTEYITVADKRSFVLSFYTDAKVKNDYIDEVFNTFECDYFENERGQNKSILEFVLPALTIIFAIITVLITVNLLMDIRRKHKMNEEPDFEEDSQEKPE